MKKSLLPETWPNNIKCKYFMKNTTSKFPSVSEPTDIPLLALLTATNDNSKLTYQYNNKKKVYNLTAIKLGNCLEKVTSTDCWPTLGQRLADCWPRGFFWELFFTFTLNYGHDYDCLTCSHARESLRYLNMYKINNNISINSKKVKCMHNLPTFPLDITSNNINNLQAQIHMQCLSFWLTQPLSAMIITV